MIKPELLSPAGDLERGELALEFNADAIYIGGKAYSLRARASNFDFEQIASIVNFAHNLNKKVYVAVNVICHNTMLTNAANYLQKLINLKVDAFIIADPFILQTLLKLNSNVEIHISTQQSVSNSLACRFWKKQQAKRIVLAREVSFNELKLLVKNLNKFIDLEYFVHGAVCIAYSGRCQMSGNFSFRDANVGGCAQSCRWLYDVKCDDKTLTNTAFTMSAKDMNLVNFICNLMDLEIVSFKIEGRMKSLHYIATIVNAYHQAITMALNKEKIKNFIINEIAKASARPTSVGWYEGYPGVKEMLYHDVQNLSAKQDFVFQVSKILGDNKYEVITKNNFKALQNFEVFGPDDKSILRDIKISQIFDEKGKCLDVSKEPTKKVIILTKNVLYLKDIGRLKNN